MMVTSYSPLTQTFINPIDITDSDAATPANHNKIDGAQDYRLQY